MSELVEPGQGKPKFPRWLHKQRGQQALFSLLFAASTIGILGYLLYRERDLLFNHVWKINVIPLLLSIPIYLLALVMVSWIWGGMVNAISPSISFKRHFIYYSIANVTKRLPGTVWYVASRVHLYRDEGLDSNLLSLLSGVEYVISTISSIIVALLFGAVALKQLHIHITALLVILFLCILLLHPKSFGWFCRILKIPEISLSYRTILQWTCKYSLFWVLCGVLFFTVGNIITAVPIAQLDYFIASFSLVTILAIPVLLLPSNFGVTEVGLSLLLSRVLPSSTSVLIAVAFRLLITLYDVVWAAISWRIFRTHPSFSKFQNP